MADLEPLAVLFDAYRQFYRQPADLQRARSFLRDRLERDESVIFAAWGRSGEMVGFTQLYPSFSSVSTGRIFVLNDLFVRPDVRRSGVGAGLLQAAAEHGRAAGAVRLSLSTAVDNIAAQAVYAANGWVRDTQFLHYDLSLT